MWLSQVKLLETTSVPAEPVPQLRVAFPFWSRARTRTPEPFAQNFGGLQRSVQIGPDRVSGAYAFRGSISKRCKRCCARWPRSFSHMNFIAREADAGRSNRLHRADRLLSLQHGSDGQ